MANVSQDSIERRVVETVFLVLHPDSGQLTTEMYQEKAEERAKALQANHPDKPVYIIETDRMIRIDATGKSKRIYKLERDRLQINQELL